jgi:hypothetical protein
LGYFEGMTFALAILFASIGEDCAFWVFFRLMNGKKHEMRYYHLDEFKRVKELNLV